MMAAAAQNVQFNKKKINIISFYQLIYMSVIDLYLMWDVYIFCVHALFVVVVGENFDERNCLSLNLCMYNEQKW